MCVCVPVYVCVYVCVPVNVCVHVCVCVCVCSVYVWTRGKVYDLSFGMYFMYTRCTREWCNRFGRTPNCRDSRINHTRRPGVRCTTSALVCTSCTRGVQGL